MLQNTIRFIKIQVCDIIKITFKGVGGIIDAVAVYYYCVDVLRTYYGMW